jgi:hypothetical protein
LAQGLTGHIGQYPATAVRSQFQPNRQAALSIEVNFAIAALLFTRFTAEQQTFFNQFGYQIGDGRFAQAAELADFSPRHARPTPNERRNA